MPMPAVQHRPGVAPIEDRRSAAIGLMLVAFVFFTGIDTSAKWLTTHGMPPLQAVFVRYAGHLALVAAIVLPLYGRTVFETNALKLELVRGLLLMLSTVGNFFAVKYLPLTMTSAIMFSAPLLVCALSVPLLGERVGWRRWVAILIGFIGILVVIRPGVGGVGWMALFSVFGVTCASLYFISTRRLAGVDSALTQQFYAALVATAAIAPFAFEDWTWPAGGAGWAAFLLIGVFGFAGHQCLTVAHRLAPASSLAPFVYTQILFMIGSSWWIFNQPPDAWVLLGAAIVVGSGLFVWLRERELSGG